MSEQFNSRELDTNSAGLAETMASPLTPSQVAKEVQMAQLGRHETGMAEAMDRRRQLESEDELQTAIRTRRMLAMLLLLTPFFLVADWTIASYIEPSRLAPLLIARLISALAILPLYFWLRRSQTPSHRSLLRIERMTTSGFAFLSSLMCALAGGIASIYAIGITIILVGRSTMRTDRFSEGLPSMALAVVIHPITLGMAAAMSPAIASQFGDVRQVALFATMVATNVIIMMLVLTGGNTIWQLRRQLFEARQIGRYQLKNLLGAGGMGEVWTAYFPALRRDVALKILKGASKGVEVSRFEREARATAALTHPNTVRVLDFGATDDGLWYYAMELLEGENLAQLVARVGPLEPARALNLVLQASRALVEAHAHGIVHRDIKPENLFVTKLGGEPDFVKLLDFGIAAVANHGNTVLTASGSVMGTPQYLAPEMANGMPMDERCDLYSLGAVLYFLLTGRPPYTGDTLMQLLHRVMQGQAPLPSQILGRPLPAGVDALTMRCLAIDPEQRFPSATELASALSACLHSQASEG